MARIDSSKSNLSWQCQPLTAYSQMDVMAIFKLRQDVFIIEQNCIYADIDEIDEAAYHVSAWRDTELVGCARIIAPFQINQHAAIGRLAVHHQFRGQQMGRALMLYCIEQTRALYPHTGIEISAQYRLSKFYNSLGFVSSSDVYLEDDIEHIKMRLQSAQ